MISCSAKIAVVSREMGMEIDVFESRLEMVCKTIDSGRLGGISYGGPEHCAALNRVEAQIKATRKQIAKENRAEFARAMRGARRKIKPRA